MSTLTDRPGALATGWYPAEDSSPAEVRGAFEPGIVDAATAAFDGLIRQQRAAGAVVGDHFAKPGPNDRVWGRWTSSRWDPEASSTRAARPPLPEVRPRLRRLPRPCLTAYFEGHHVQPSLDQGDAVLFSPAVLHGAGTNQTTDVCRMANLQGSPPSGEPGAGAPAGP